MFFNTPMAIGCNKQFLNIDEVCNFFAIRLIMLVSFLNDVDIQLIVEFKDSFKKYHSVFPKNQLQTMSGY